MARLDKTFPTGDCATCIISPKLVECMRDYNIDVLTMADVVAAGRRGGPLQVAGAQAAAQREGRQMHRLRRLLDRLPGAQHGPKPAGLRAERAARARPMPPGSTQILARHEGSLGRLMPVLQEISETYGYLPRSVLEHLAARWELRVAEILRVASFYDRFDLEPVGRHVVEVCAGTSCHSRRSRLLLERLEKELGVGRRPDRQVGTLHPADRPLPRPLCPVAGHEDRRPELRPREPRPGAGNPGAILMSQPIRNAARPGRERSRRAGHALSQAAEDPRRLGQLRSRRGGPGGRGGRPTCRRRTGPGRRRVPHRLHRLLRPGAARGPRAARRAADQLRQHDAGEDPHAACRRTPAAISSRSGPWAASPAKNSFRPARPTTIRRVRRSFSRCPSGRISISTAGRRRSSSAIAARSIRCRWTRRSPAARIAGRCAR